jgi:Uncharacterized conserved protein (DUF2304)
MEHLLNLMAVFSAVLIIVVLITLRRAHFRVEYSVSWLLAGVGLLVLSQSRWLLNGIASLLRISDPPLALLLIVSVTFLVVFFRYCVVLSGLKDANIAMMQRVAILEYQLRTLNEEEQITPTP